MPPLDAPTRERVAEIAGWHGFSAAAAEVMLAAVARGRGAMAQFDHPEFGARPVDARRHDDGRRHVQQCAEGARRGALRRPGGDRRQRARADARRARRRRRGRGRPPGWRLVACRTAGADSTGVPNDDR